MQSSPYGTAALYDIFVPWCVLSFAARLEAVRPSMHFPENARLLVVSCELRGGMCVRARRLRYKRHLWLFSCTYGVTEIPVAHTVCTSKAACSRMFACVCMCVC